jgi:hypothetical protein
MIQIFINEVELDLPANIGEQIAINFEAFPLGEFRNTFNNFSGNLTFPATAKNRLVFGNATNNLAPLTVTREFTGQILSGAIELFYGRVDYERFNNGFECRFVTSGQLLSEAIKQYDMFEVMYGLGRADTGLDNWFDHKYLSTYTQNGVGENAEGDKNVRYPLLDLGYFNNNNRRIGFYDLRATFNLWTLCLAIARKINKTLSFNGTLPTRLQNTFITPKDWKYSDRVIQDNGIALTLLGNEQTTGSIDAPAFGVGELTALLDPTQTKTGIFDETTTQTVLAPFTTTTLVNSEFSFGTNFEFAIAFKFNVSNLRYRTVDTDFQQLIEFKVDCNVKNGNVTDFEYSVLPDFNAGYSSAFPSGRTPNLRLEGNKVVIAAFANQSGISPNGNNVSATLVIKFKGSKILPDGDDLEFTINETEWGVRYTTGNPLVQPQGQVNINFDYFSPIAENYIKVTHDERIFPRGLISGTDLMGSLKPADVLKYAMRLTGSYLVETDTAITLVPFSDYDKADAIDWSGKVNFLQQPIVDYRDNELGKDNWLVYQQDDTNTALDPYYLGGNLPTNLGNQIVTLYEAPFAQSAFNQTFQGALSLVRVPYYDAPLAYIYKVWVDDATAYSVGQFVGFEGRLFKVLTNTTGSDGNPTVNTADYEEVDFSVFNNQSPEYRAIEVLTDQVTGVQVYNNLLDTFYTKQDVGALNGIDFQQAITDGYGFIPSTFLDYRQLIIQVSLSDLDIHNLDLKKLVFISELNAYFYINKVEEYTPDTNVDTTVTLTMLP